MRGGKPSRTMALLYLFVLLVGSVIPLTMIWSALQPDGNAYVRWQGTRFPIPWSEGRMLFGILGAILVLLLAWNAFFTSRAFRAAPSVSEPRLELTVGEGVQWHGHLGLASFSRERLIVLALILLGALPLAGALWWLWGVAEMPSDSWAYQLALTGAFLLILGPMAFGPLYMLMFRDNRWLCELVGSVAITDRRLLWSLPGGRVVHEMTTEKLLGAELIETADDRGWISLRVRRARLVDDSYELRGVPDPEAAVAALRRLIAYR